MVIDSKFDRDAIKKLCDQYSLWPSRSKGQNFLIDQEVLKKIVEAADLKPIDTILEIGPGLGILTQALIAKAKKVYAVELDKKFVDFLRAQFADSKNLEIINEDILKLTDARMPWSNYKIVANLPYNITSIFLKKFLTGTNKPSQMVLMLQQEVAQRICAKPGQLSILGLSVQFYGTPEIVAKVSKDCFWPEPEVDSAIVRIKLLTSEEIRLRLLLAGDKIEVSDQEVFRIIKIGFSAKRKQLQNNLKNGLKIEAEIIKKMLTNLELDPQIRPQALTLEQWITLAKKLKSYFN